MATLSMLISSILGGFGTFLIITAALTTQSGNVQGAQSLALTLFHFLVVMLALPFLLKALHTEGIPKWYVRVISTESILNAIFMLLESTVTEENKFPFVIFALLELLPVYWIRRNKWNIEYDDLEFDEYDDPEDI